MSDSVDRVETRDDGKGVVYFTPEGDALSVTYFVEAPSGLAETGQDSFGPVEARAGDGPWITVDGTRDSNVVVGPEQP